MGTTSTIDGCLIEVDNDYTGATCGVYFTIGGDHTVTNTAFNLISEGKRGHSEGIILFRAASLTTVFCPLTTFYRLKRHFMQAHGIGASGRILGCQKGRIGPIRFLGIISRPA